MPTPLQTAKSAVANASGVATLTIAGPLGGQQWIVNPLSVDTEDSNGAAVVRTNARAKIFGSMTGKQFYGVIQGPPGQAGPFTFQTNDQITVIGTGLTANDRMIVTVWGWVLQPGESPFDLGGPASSGILALGPSFSGLHADLSDTGTDAHPHPILTVVELDQHQGATLQGAIFRTGRYYTMNGAIGVFSSASHPINTIRGIPFTVEKEATFDRIGIDNRADTGVASTARLGIYNDDGAGYPSSLVLDAGTVSTENIGVKEITIAQTLTPGRYWLVVKPATAAPSLRILAGSQQPFYIGASTIGSGTSVGWTVADAAGVLPANFPVGATGLTDGPLIMLRVQ